MYSHHRHTRPRDQLSLFPEPLVPLGHFLANLQLWEESIRKQSSAQQKWHPKTRYNFFFFFAPRQSCPTDRPVCAHTQKGSTSFSWHLLTRQTSDSNAQTDLWVLVGEECEPVSVLERNTRGFCCTKRNVPAAFRWTPSCRDTYCIRKQLCICVVFLFFLLFLFLTAYHAHMHRHKHSHSFLLTVQTKTARCHYFNTSELKSDGAKSGISRVLLKKNRPLPLLPPLPPPLP